MIQKNEVLVLGLVLEKDEDGRIRQGISIEGIVGKFLGEEGRQKIIKKAYSLFDEIGEQITQRDPDDFINILRSVLNE